MGRVLTPRRGRYTAGEETRYAMYKRRDGPQGPPGRLRQVLPPTGIRSPARPARIIAVYSNLIWKYKQQGTLHANT